jgi:hypothetical protein
VSASRSLSLQPALAAAAGRPAATAQVVKQRNRPTWDR